MPTITSSITLAGHACILPNDIAPEWKAHGKATSLLCPVGPAPTRGWVLLKREDRDALEDGPLSLEWTIKDLSAGTETTTTFVGLYPIDHGRQGFGGVGDGEAVFLVELVDARYLAAHASDSGLIAANVRSYAMNNAESGASAYLEGTEDTTWASLAAAAWGTCPQLGAFPGLPFAPDWIPEGIRFVGTSGYAALNSLLDFLDCAIAHNPIAGTYSIVQLGAAQAIAAHTAELKWDSEQRSFPTGFAANVTSYFPTHYLPYGQERDTERLANWSVRDDDPEGFRYATSLADAGVAGGTGSVARWQDLPRLIDRSMEDINPGRRVTRTTAVASRYTMRMSVERKHRVYWGIVSDILPGAQVRAVQWRCTNKNTGNGLPTETEIVAGPYLPRDAHDIATACSLQPTENFAGHDLARRTTPTYPRLPNIVQVYSSEGTGSLVDPQAVGDIFVHRGKLRRWVGEEMKTLEDVAILFVDDFDNKKGEIKAVAGDYYGPARLTGTIDLDGDKPLYTVRRGGATEELVFFELLSDITLDGSADAEILNGDVDDWVGSGKFIIVQDPFETPGMWQGYTTYRGWAKKHPTGDKYDIVWMERIAQWILYQLTGDLVKTNPGDPFDFEVSGLAQVVDYHDQGKDPTALGGPPLRVWHADTQYLAWHVEGCLGWAHWNDRERRYEITTPQLQCMFIEGTLYNPLCEPLEFDMLATNLSSVDQGYYSYKVVEFLPEVAEGVPARLPFLNPRAHIGEIGRKVLLMGYKESEDSTSLTWQLVDIEPKTLDVVTSVGGTGCNKVLNTTRVKVETCGVSGDGIPLGFEAVQVVNDWTRTSGTYPVGHEQEGEPYCQEDVTKMFICAIPASAPETTTYNNVLTPVLVDAYFDSDGFWGEVRGVWGPCNPTDLETVDLGDIEPCEEA